MLQKNILKWNGNSIIHWLMSKPCIRYSVFNIFTIIHFYVSIRKKNNKKKMIAETKDYFGKMTSCACLRFLTFTEFSYKLGNKDSYKSALRNVSLYYLQVNTLNNIWIKYLRKCENVKNHFYCKHYDFFEFFIIIIIMARYILQCKYNNIYDPPKEGVMVM